MFWAPKAEYEMFFRPEPHVWSLAEMVTETGPLVQPLFAGRGVGEADAVDTGGVVSAMYVNVSALVAGLLPLGVVTRTSTVPHAWAGAWTVRRSGDSTLTLVPAAD